MAVSLEAVRSANSQLKSLRPGLVGVFVGGTSGIGEAALRAFAHHTTSPTIYLVGRNEDAASKIIADVKNLNPDGVVHFVKSDTSLIKNVDTACKEIQAEKVNVLFMTTGYVSLDGRNATTEGIDKKFSLHYYSRWRFVHNLLPQLTTAANEDNSVSRVVSVLGVGHEVGLVEDDLDLKQNFSLRNCMSHSIIFNDFACEELAKKNPGTAFVHLEPGGVATGAMDHSGAALKIFSKVAQVLLKPFYVPLPESGERNLYHATSSMFPPKNTASDGAAIGSDGTKGSGAYLLNWCGKVSGNASVLNTLRARGIGPKIWKHTHDVWNQATQ